jgi:hypothetical protein
LHRIAAFAAAFPHNSPAYFCASAMQGLALGVASTQLLCVRSEPAPSWQPGSGDGLAAAYDQFWDLAELASKHRKRAATRRACWNGIVEATSSALRQHLI